MFLQFRNMIRLLFFVHGFHELVPDFTHFVADFAKLPVFGAILSNTVI